MPNNSKQIPKFFVDAMLGNIAKKLRLIGYDTEYSSSIEDYRLIECAKKEERIIVSRDVELINKAEKLKIKSIFLKDSSENDQLLEIVKKSDIKQITINGNSARCPKCNFSTIPIKKENVKDKIPQGVLDHNDKFWICKNCNQIYWEGTHVKNLQKLIDDVNERL